MITITKDKLIIEFIHPCPDEVLRDIQLAIIRALQHQSGDAPKATSYFLLELLKQTMDLDIE